MTMNLGIVGLDGHGPVFADVVNGSEPQIDGVRVVAAMPVPSVMIDDARLAENVEKTRALDIEIVDTPDALAAGVDGILILHDDGSKHLELVRQFADKGKPLFVDKPVEASAAAAAELVRVCREAGCPVFSGSSLRFSVEMQQCLSRQGDAAVLSALTFSPYSPKPTMPGWIYYGIHAVEPLYAIMGPGCREVRCTMSTSGPMALGVWADGRIGAARAIEGGPWEYGFTAWRTDGVQTAKVDASRIYPELLKNIKAFFETATAPVDPAESVEVIAFMEAANRSMAEDGAAVALPTATT